MVRRPPLYYRARPTIRASMSRATRVILLLKHGDPVHGLPLYAA
jgi:hypothetical protein